MADEPVEMRALLEAVRERAADSEDPLVLLETATTVAAEAGQTADALVERYVGAARAAGLSWTVIGDRLGVSKQAARERFAHRLHASDLLTQAAAATTVEPRLVACIEVANTAAAEDDSVPGTQHLLVGLLHAGFAATVLDHLGVTREKIRATTGHLFEPAVVTAVEGQQRRVVGDGEAEHALLRARRMAAQRGQLEVRTEHALLAIGLDPGSAAHRVLNEIGVDPARIKKELARCLPSSPRSRRAGKGRAGRSCSFCGCTDPGRPMVAGPGVWICRDCVQLSLSILRERAGTLMS